MYNTKSTKMPAEAHTAGFFNDMSCVTDRARILVLGDSGVGKTSLVHLIAHGKPLSQISYTVGAAVEVKLHEYREGTASQKTYWIGKN